MNMEMKSTGVHADNGREKGVAGEAERWEGQLHPSTSLTPCSRRSPGARGCLGGLSCSGFTPRDPQQGEGAAAPGTGQVVRVDPCCGGFGHQPLPAAAGSSKDGSNLCQTSSVTWTMGPDSPGKDAEMILLFRDSFPPRASRGASSAPCVPHYWADPDALSPPPRLPPAAHAAALTLT